MMEMLYRNTPDGDGKLGTLIDAWCLNTAPSKAVRGRRHLLAGQLASLTYRKLNQSRTVRIMNMSVSSLARQINRRR